MESELIGSAMPKTTSPFGLGLNTKNGSIENVEFYGITPEGIVLFRVTQNKGIKPVVKEHWKEIKHFENDFEDLVEFSNIKDESGIAKYAEKHGPLFGGLYYQNGLIREPVEMWKTAILLMGLAVEFQAAYEVGDWQKLQNKITAFEAEVLMDERQKIKAIKEQGYILKDNQPFVVYAISRLAPDIPEDYRYLTLNTDSELNNGLWQEERYDDPGLEVHSWVTRAIPEMGLFDKTDNDRLAIEYEKLPNISTAIFFNWVVDGVLDETLPDRIHRMPLEQLGDASLSVGKMLCRGMVETLISIHIRQIPYGWIGHEFWPLFQERIRYMWYVLSCYKDKSKLDYCAHCGSPFLKTRADKKYCSPGCKRNANK